MNKYEILAFSSSAYGPNTEICRYLTFEKFAWLIEKSQLYHCRLDQFQDPFEGAVTRPFATRRDTDESIKKLGGPADVIFYNMRMKFSSYATCWYASSVQSDAMWKLYSSQHAGVAIVSTPRRLSDAVGLLPRGYYGSVCPVMYLDFAKDDMRLKNGITIRPGFAKPVSFKFEEEVRGLLVPFPGNISEEILKNSNLFSNVDAVGRHIDALPKGINVPVNLSVLIQSIVISPLAEDWFGELVKNLADRAGLSAAIRTPELIEPIY